MQESLTLSNPPVPPDALAATGGSPAPSLEYLSTQVHALRGVVQSQQTQLRALQQQEQAQPLVGWTTDSPWGLALEGLVMGAVALGLGAASMWGFRATPQRKVLQSPVPSSTAERAAFSDSMLYLADQEEAQGEPVAVSARLHDPRYDNRGKVLAQDDDDAELDYYRMALTQQGLSVTAGAGQVDSERIPLDDGVTGAVTSPAEAVHSVFASPPTVADFDQRAAAEEVERVRRYLAQRRADRAKPRGGAAPASDAPREPVSWDSLVADLAQSAPTDTLPDQPVLAVQGQGDVIEHTGLAEGASLLASLSEQSASEVDGVGPWGADADTDTAKLQAPSANLLEWETPEQSVAVPALETVTQECAIDGLEPALPSTEVQLQLAIEFRDLGLWDEARERVLEVLARPDDGLHGQANALLEELAQTAPAPVGVDPQINDPWASPHTD